MYSSEKTTLIIALDYTIYNLIRVRNAWVQNIDVGINVATLHRLARATLPLRAGTAMRRCRPDPLPSGNRRSVPTFSPR